MKKKILISCMAFHFGDFVWATSAIAILKKTYPDIHITVLASKPLKVLIDNNPVIDDAIYSKYPPKGDSLIVSLKNLFLNLLYVPKIIFSRFDECIIFNRSFITVLIAKLCFIPIVGANLRIGFDEIEPLSKFYAYKIKVPGKNFHASLRFQTIIKSHFGIFNNALPVLPDVSGYDRVSKQFINPKKINIAVCPKGSSDIGNRWAHKNFVEVIDALSEKFDANFFIVGSEINIKDAKKIMDMSKRKNIYDLCGKTSILEIINFLSFVDLTISVDTGIPHFAAYGKKPLINICGSCPAYQCAAMSVFNKILDAGLHGCFCCNIGTNMCQDVETMACFELIKPQQVIKIAISILSTPS